MTKPLSDSQVDNIYNLLSNAGDSFNDVRSEIIEALRIIDDEYDDEYDDEAVTDD